MADAHQAFERAFKEHSDELFRHASIRLSDRERALELTQECFTRTWEYMARGGQVHNFRPFLYRTLKHLIIDEYRKHKPHSLEAMVEGSEGGSVEMLLPAEETNTIAAAIERFEGAEALQKLQELPDQYREVLTMRYVEGLAPKEIAEYLEESENAVSVRIHRGLHKLRMLLEETDTQ